MFSCPKKCVMHHLVSILSRLKLNGIRCLYPLHSLSGMKNFDFLCVKEHFVSLVDCTFLDFYALLKYWCIDLDEKEESKKLRSFVQNFVVDSCTQLCTIYDTIFHPFSFGSIVTCRAKRERRRSDEENCVK